MNHTVFPILWSILCFPCFIKKKLLSHRNVNKIFQLPVAIHFNKIFVFIYFSFRTANAFISTKFTKHRETARKTNCFPLRH